jgi:hypothetical protein
LSINEGLFSKASAPRLFLEDGNIFRKSASVVQWGIAVEFVPRRPIFENVLLFEKKGGVRIFARVCMAGCMGRISHTNLKIRMVISRIATSKNHIELLVPGQI